MTTFLSQEEKTPYPDKEHWPKTKTNNFFKVVNMNSIILNDRRLTALVVILGTRQGFLHSLLPFLFHILLSPSQCSKKTKWNKKGIEYKRRKKLSLRTDNIIVYVGNPKKSTKVLESIHELSNSLQNKGQHIKINYFST